jgi:hypothetical protein
MDTFSQVRRPGRSTAPVTSPVQNPKPGSLNLFCFVVYYESIKRELKIKPIYECQCDGRLQTKRFTCLTYTRVRVNLVQTEKKVKKTKSFFACRNGQTGRSGSDRIGELPNSKLKLRRRVL